MWLEIAEAGRESSFKGRPITFSADMLDKTVSNYDSRYHQAPVVIGDPTDGSPADGWVETLKRSGSKLLARVTVVNPQFEENLKRGKGFRRVIEIYPASMMLKRVRFYESNPSGAGFCEGGDFMFLEYDEKNGDPGEILKRKVIELMSYPRRIDAYGQPIDWNSLTYSKAFEIVCQENPELTQRYIDYLDQIRRRNSQPYATLTTKKEG